MKKSFILALVASLLMSISLTAEEREKKIDNNGTEAPVTITTASYQLITYKDANGTEATKWVRATLVTPGDVVKYINIVSNNTEQNITKLKISNPIDENLEFLADTATGENNSTVLYSIDAGKSYNVPSKLFVGKGKDKRPAMPKEYNSIQWTIAQVDANSTTPVEFQAKLK